MNNGTETFAHAFGEALRDFLDQNGISVTQAASRLGMNKQTLSSYWTDNAGGKRPNARAELLFLACTELGFVFRFGGSGVRATPRKAIRKKPTVPAPNEQLRLPFAREFFLANEKGTVSVTVKRPAGEIQLAVRLKAVS